MNSRFIFRASLYRTLVMMLLSTLFSHFCWSQTSPKFSNSGVCKQLVIKGAQLAHQAHLSSKESYFSNSPADAKHYIDTAIFYIEEAMVSIDSAIILASDSDVLALQYTKQAKDFASRSYQRLINAKNDNAYSNHGLVEEAMFYGAHATLEAYHASFYFKDTMKEAPKPEEATIEKTHDVVTRLDIDQTSFTLLSKELQDKEKSNKAEIDKLSKALNRTKDPSQQLALKAQLADLVLQEKEIARKNTDVQQKLTSITALIEERNHPKIAPTQSEEAIVAKNTSTSEDEWRKQIHLDAELPEGLTYQVQLGVYKNQIAVPTIFKGLKPIYGKTTPNGISYSAGLFEKLSDAKEARAYIVKMGLTDAFVTAYYHKKKITLSEAQKLEKK